MANFISKKRSSRFEVKDPDAFVKWLKRCPGVSYTRIEGEFSLQDDPQDDTSGWPYDPWLDLEDWKQLVQRPQWSEFEREHAVTSAQILECIEKNTEPEDIEYQYSDFDLSFDFFTELQKHLPEGIVAIFMEVGSEKYRYLVGQSIAVSSKEIKVINLSDIYEVAKSMGSFNLAES